MFKKLFSFMIKDKTNGKNKYASVDHYVTAAGDPNSLGAILIDLGYITKIELGAAIETQKQREIMIGIILMEMNMVNKEQLNEALIEQKIRLGVAQDHEMHNFAKNRVRKYADAMEQLSNDLRELTKVSVAAKNKVEQHN